MVVEARRRAAGRRDVRICLGDAHDLPLADACADRARMDRVLQHLADPDRALAEARRVLRPTGILAMAEPDWDTLAVADEDVETSRRWARFVAGRVRNPTIGRQLVAAVTRVGFQARSVEAVAVVFRDIATADEILGLRRNAARSVEAGAMTADVTRRWLDRLGRGPFLAGFTVYLVTATA